MFIAALKPEMTNAETCTFDIKYKTPKHKFKRASESSLESLGLISEIDLFGEELDNEEEALQIHSKDDIVPDNIIEVRKGKSLMIFYCRVNLLSFKIIFNQS